MPAAFAGHEDAYRAGVLTGRTEVLEWLTKYSGGILERMKSAPSDSKRLAHLKGGFDAVAEFIREFLQHARGG